MIETRVRIVSTGRGLALVEPTEPSGCGACHARSACGVAGLGKALSPRRRPIAVPCGDQARIGDELLLAIDESDLLRAGLLAYLLPALLAVAGAGLAGLAGQGDTGAAAGMAAGTATGLFIARLVGRAPRIAARPAPYSVHQGEAP